MQALRYSYLPESMTAADVYAADLCHQYPHQDDVSQQPE
jgi:hypothetical protein